MADENDKYPNLPNNVRFHRKRLGLSIRRLTEVYKESVNGRATVSEKSISTLELKGTVGAKIKHTVFHAINFVRKERGLEEIVCEELFPKGHEEVEQLDEFNGEDG